MAAENMEPSKSSERLVLGFGLTFADLYGAAKSDSVANLTVRLPIVVIGGGLTAIDTATEAFAYYPVQVEKFLARYERQGRFGL